MRLNFEMQNFGIIGGGLKAGSVGTLSFSPINIRGTISLNTINFPVVQLTNNRTITISLGLYSMNGSTLSLENSASGTYGTGVVGIHNSIGVFIGLTAISKTQDVTPGTWYLGVLYTTAGGDFSFYGPSANISKPVFNNFTGAFLGGQMTVSTAALPTAYSSSNLSVSNTNTFLVPQIIISA